MLLDIIRAVLIYAHLIFFAVAVTNVLWTDFLVLSDQLAEVKLEKVGKRLSLLLVGLWLSGLIIVYIDTGFDVQIIKDNGKLVLKLICVLVLCANGIVLHNISFSILQDPAYLSRKRALVLSITGALSTSHWLMAAFIGCTESLATMDFSMLFSLYAICCLSILGLAIAINSLLHYRINLQRAQNKLRELNLIEFS